MTVKRSVEVCFSPVSYPIFKNDNAIVVVIDVFRATSAICTALYHKAASIIPVATIEEALIYKAKGYMTAAERNGEIVLGFKFGNSPFSYMGKDVVGQTIVLTTTNGTQAIETSKNAFCVAIGSFLNLSVLCEWLMQENRDVILLCAGWKNKFNLEDALFSGAVAQKLFETGNFVNSCDTAQAACHLYDSAKEDLFGFLENSSHRKRLEKLSLDRDIRYCLEMDKAPVIPVLKGMELVKLI